MRPIRARHHIVIISLITCLLPNNRLQNKALVVANEIMNAFDKNDPDAIQRARKIAEEVFGEGWSAKKEKVYEEGPEKALIWGIGESREAIPFAIRN